MKPSRAALSLAALLLTVAPALAQPPAGRGPYFPLDAVWYQDISQAPVDAESAAVIAFMANLPTTPDANDPPNLRQGWGVNQIDRSIEVIRDNGSAPFLPFVPNGDWYDVECDLVDVPVPTGGAIEGENDYMCTGYPDGGDCHLIVYRPASNRLYEMWRANVAGTNPGDFEGGCLAVWNTRVTYPAEGRGQDCTSADAAGYPMAPLLVNADEVWDAVNSGIPINHAIRFVLPNSRIRDAVYVHPATHTTGPASGGASTPPYGARLRLRADFNLASLPNAGIREVAKAMQKYGILLSDGGNLAWTFQSDQFTTRKWQADLGMGVNDLDVVSIADFQMVAGGTRYLYQGDCARTDPLFYDGFELGLPPYPAATIPKWDFKRP